MISKQTYAKKPGSDSPRKQLRLVGDFLFFRHKLVFNTVRGFFCAFTVLTLFAVILGRAQDTQGIKSTQLSPPQHQFNISQDTQYVKDGISKKKQQSSPPKNRRRDTTISLRDLPPADTGRVIARIGGKVILMDELIRRAEYTIRPPYCRGNGGFEKKIVLNSLLAEKMLALEAGKDNELIKNESFQRMLQGRKEQLMRQVMYYAEGTSKVHLDTVEIRREYKIAGRTYHLEFFNVPNDSVAKAVKNILNTSATSFNAIYRSLSGRDTLPQRDFSWNSKESKAVHEVLFKDNPKVNQIIGPVQVNDESHLFMRVKGWTDHVSITEKQYAERLKDVKEELTEEQADEHFDKFIMRLMGGKSLRLEPATFKKFVEIVAPDYLVTRKEKEESILDDAFHRQSQENPKSDDIERNLSALRDAPLFTIDNKVWTVNEVVKEMERHPLVFRNKNLNNKYFAEQLKLAIVDMVRDRYLSNEAYKRGFDKYPTVVHYTEMWQDAIISLWQKEFYLKSIGATDNGDMSVIEKYLNPYIDSLMHKYSVCIEINVDELDKFELVGIDMFVLQKDVPFTVFVPSFPQLTTHKWLDYGRKMDSGMKK